MTKSYDSFDVPVFRYPWFADRGGEWPDSHEDDNVKRRKGSPTKDDLVINSFDKQPLMRLLNSTETSAEDRAELEDLTHEIERGTEVQPQEIPPDVVTMNSCVRVTDVEDGRTYTYTIVFPSDADYETGKISILSPLGTALLGYRIGDVVNWDMPGGTRQVRIDELIYQPEAAGDFHI
jgi:regulator of nucleoside diphosphate kinase